MRWVSEDGVDGREGKQEEAPTLLLLAEGRRASVTGLSLRLLPALLSSLGALTLSTAVRGCVRWQITEHFTARVAAHVTVNRCPPAALHRSCWLGR
jgi:hypothetical protein